MAFKWSQPWGNTSDASPSLLILPNILGLGLLFWADPPPLYHTVDIKLKNIALCLKRKNFFQILHLARFEPTTYSRRSSRYRSNHWATKLVWMWESNLCTYSKPKIDHFCLVFKGKKGEKRSRHWYRVFNWCVEQCLEAVAKQICTVDLLSTSIAWQASMVENVKLNNDLDTIFEISVRFSYIVSCCFFTCYPQFRGK